MSPSSLANLAAVAAHLGIHDAAPDPRRLRWRRDVASPVVDLHWDDERRLLRLRAPLGIDVARVDARELALAVSAINLRLEVFGVELADELAFASHLFFESDGTVSTAGLDRCLVAVDECAARTSAAIAELDDRHEPPR